MLLLLKSKPHMGGYLSTLKLTGSRFALYGAYLCGRLRFDDAVP